MFRNIIKAIAGDPNQKEIQKHAEVVAQTNDLEPQFRALSDDELRAKTDEFKARLADATGSHDDPQERHAVEQATLDELLPEAFAAVREASMRTLGQRHFDVQLIGGIALHQGKIAEMRTGEGKTLVATLPSYLNALTGRGVHIVTVNDYLARRDARWMGPIYQMLGLTVGVLQEAARTENGRKAFLFDPAREAASEDQHQLRMVDRRETYAADIVYGTNHEFGFDYLRDNMAYALDARVQRERYFAIVDEVDNILIDEARTPLIISGPSQEDPTLYYQIAKVVRQLKPEDYEIDERSRGIALTEVGEAHLEKILGQPLRDPDRPEELTPEQARLLGHVEQAMRADFLFKRNKDYLVEGGKVIIVDEFTGRKMLGRRWSDGLHQAVEAKEGLTVQQDNVTYATITLQNYFRLYAKLAGMSGTALTEAEEFDKIYKLGVVAIPTNLEYQATRPESGLVEVEYREDGHAQRFRCFARRDDPEKKPVLWRRKDYPDEVYRTEEAKLRSLTTEILRRHLLGQPLLVGTTSVELSERVSDRLRPEPLQRLAQVMLIREAWFEKNEKEEDGMLVSELQPLDVKLDELNRQELAKRLKELGLSTNPAGEENAARLARILSLPDESRPELTRALQAGIRHNVLNAKKHDEESQIIAGAGALGAVTIATNMAGRGVDIKLGGEMAEEVLTAVNRVLRKARHDNPYNYSNEQRRAELLRIPDAEWGIYEAECRLFLQAMEDAVKVKQVGGLHVVGSERHEARRIDNQLRGRAARQGDPGSSQFYLSLEDELMRRFGGQGVSDLMQRLKIDDSVPVQAGLVNKTIEQSQTRVEGYNFDVRKHLLEYDDVLNTQRNRIYEQRDRIFVKEDLTEDFFEMVEAEVARRVDLAMADKEGRWRLFAWLEEAQPSLPLDPNGNEFYPSYLIEILLRDLEDKSDKRAALLELARNALESERQHLLETVEAQVDHVEERLDAQIKEKRQTAELALEALENEAEETGKRIEARAAYKAAGEALGIANFQPSAAEMRDFDLNEFKKQRLPELAEATVSARMRAGLIGAIERRIGASLGLGNQFTGRGESQTRPHWNDVRQQLLEAAEKSHRARAERSLAEIERELANLPAVSEATVSEATPSRSQLIRALINMAWGTMRGFDQKTHRAVLYRTQRLTYFFTAAEMVEDWDAADFKEEIGAHLHGAVDAFRNLWGEAEFKRLAGIGARVGDLPQAVQPALRSVGGIAAGTALGDLGAEAQAAVQSELGQAALTNLFRQLMLQVIGQLWVEYLTSVEALRTSIGLEAYAQRDPLVAYKSKAFEMFQELLVNMRAGVVARAFTFRPRAQQVEAPARGAAQAAANGGSAAPPESARNLGRNDPCWCGSGKKYKDCHWEADHRQRAAQAPAAAAPSTAASASPALRSASAQDAAVGEAGGGGKRRRRRR